MSIFLKELILNKLKRLTPEEVLHYGRQYGFSVSRQEAESITDYLKKHNIDPFNEKDRKRAFQNLAQITSPATAEKAETLLVRLIKTYGLESLFN